MWGTVKHIVALVFVVALSMSAQSDVLTVPTVFSTIGSALDSSNTGDTILLLPGDYAETIDIPHTLTIASQWLFSGDTNVAMHTSIRSPSARLINVNSCSLRIAGIRFRAGEPRTDSMQIIRGSNVVLQLDLCRLEGVFTTTRFFSTALLYLAGTTSAITANDCRVYADSVAATPVMFCRNITLNRCVFLGRTNSTAYNELMPAIRSRNFLWITDSYFDIRGEGIGEVTCLVERTRFVRSGSMAFSFGGQFTNRFEQCVFDSTEMIESATIFRFSSTTEFVRCSFTNASGNGEGPLLSSNAKFVIDSCTFVGNHGFSRFLTTNRLVMRNSRFESNLMDVLWKYDLSYDSVYITMCDFIGTSRLVGGPYNFSALPAPDCYWGDSTGPNHPQNPGGLGMALPGYADPFPFQTQPIFPDVAAPEPITETDVNLPQPFQFSLYPNPTNASTTIRFAVPIASPMRGELYDRTGRLVTGFTIDQNYFSRGLYPIQLVDTPSGLYFVRLSSSQASTTQPLVIVK